MMSTERLATTFVEIAGTLVDDYDLMDFLHQLTLKAAEITGAGAVGLLLADPEGRLQFMAASNREGQRLEGLILATGEGPCWDCFATGAPVAETDLETAGHRWPTFAAAAVATGYRSAHAIPLRMRHQTIGSLGLFDAAVLHFDDVETGVVQSLADVATIAILQERALSQAVVLAEQLQSALTSRIVIEQAKGMLARSEQTTLDVAFEVLRRRARTSGQRLRDVAQAVLDGEELPPVA